MPLLFLPLAAAVYLSLMAGANDAAATMHWSSQVWCINICGVGVTGTFGTGVQVATRLCAMSGSRHVKKKSKSRGVKASLNE